MKNKYLIKWKNGSTRTVEAVELEAYNRSGQWLFVFRNSKSNLFYTEPGFLFIVAPEDGITIEKI